MLKDLENELQEHTSRLLTNANFDDFKKIKVNILSNLERIESVFLIHEVFKKLTFAPRSYLSLAVNLDPKPELLINGIAEKVDNEYALMVWAHLVDAPGVEGVEINKFRNEIIFRDIHVESLHEKAMKYCEQLCTIGYKKLYKKKTLK